MPDNKNIIAPDDKRRIDINDPSEVSNWCRSFNCTAEELKAAVKAAGSTYANEVKKYL